MRAGVELDGPRGINNGTVQGHRYFSCAPKHGLLCPVSKVTLSHVQHRVVAEDFEDFDSPIPVSSTERSIEERLKNLETMKRSILNGEGQTLDGSTSTDPTSIQFVEDGVADASSTEQKAALRTAIATDIAVQDQKVRDLTAKLASLQHASPTLVMSANGIPEDEDYTIVDGGNDGSMVATQDPRSVSLGPQPGRTPPSYSSAEMYSKTHDSGNDDVRTKGGIAAEKQKKAGGWKASFGGFGAKVFHAILILSWRAPGEKMQWLGYRSFDGAL